MLDRLFFWTAYVTSAAATGIVAAAVSGPPRDYGPAGADKVSWLDNLCLVEPDAAVFVVADTPFCVRTTAAPAETPAASESSGN